MSTVFKHRDVDGDTFRVSEWHHPEVLSFEVIPEVDSTFVNMNRDAVLSLIQVLTEWAYPTHTPEGPNRSLIEELIVKAVKDQVSAVLPLHLSPAGRSVELVGWDAVRGANGDIVAFQYPGMTEHRPQECPGAGQCPEADPEPGDVGHPEEPVAEPACGHLRDRHRPNCAQFAPGRGVCRCNAFQERASLPVRERMWRPEDSRPKGPICGLCKRPWNDGHGQPGDPCPGVEEARQHPGDWTDALWRVRPSAPASEARYCDECGHSWEVHAERGVADTWCTATKGKGRCGCTRRPE